jgi:hypothetical protein
MNIKVHWIGKNNAYITVCADNATLELNVLNTIERKQLAEHLREVADNLFPLEDNND